jgi:small basic protein
LNYLLYIIAGVALGIIAGLKLNVGYNPEYTVYISLSILAMVNTIFTILCKNIKGEIKIIKSAIYLASDLIFALFLGYLGEQLGLPIYLAAVFAFGNNIYKNSRAMIDFVIAKYNIM